tara:strand:- start:3589 stop:4116 length:528 start_codon:yes stop_codon:yes gene_type:complete
MATGKYPTDEIILISPDMSWISLGKEKMTPLELHRAICEIGDLTMPTVGFSFLDISMERVTYRVTDNQIVMPGPYRLSDESIKLLYGGALKIWDMNYANFKIIGMDQADIDNTKILIGDKIYEGNDFLAHADNKRIIAFNGDNSHDVREYITGNNKTYKGELFGTYIVPFVTSNY